MFLCEHFIIWSDWSSLELLWFKTCFMFIVMHVWFFFCTYLLYSVNQCVHCTRNLGAGSLHVLLIIGVCAFIHMYVICRYENWCRVSILYFTQWFKGKVCNLSNPTLIVCEMVVSSKEKKSPLALLRWLHFQCWIYILHLRIFRKWN